jgi:uncharacterized protein (UPF0335 family)
MTTLKQAQIDGNLETFISEHEPLETEKEAVQRYINASAIPLESSKEDQSDDFLDGSDDCT